MLKGTLEGIVLAILSGRPAYGYEITAWLREQGFSDIAEGTVAAALAAEQVGRGHPDVVEEQLGGVLRVQADLVQLAAAGEAGHAALRHEQADAVRARLRFGAGHHDHQVGVDPVGDEGLGAVEHPAVAVPDRGGADALQVAACGGFGHRDRADALAGRHRRQPAGLLLLGAQVDEVGDGDVVLQAEPRAERRRAHRGELFHHHAAEAEVLRAEAAEPLRYEMADDGLLASRQPGLAVDDVLLLPALLVRRDLALDVGLDDLAERLVIGLVEVPAHVFTGLSTPERASRRTPARLPARPAR